MRKIVVYCDAQICGASSSPQAPNQGMPDGWSEVTINGELKELCPHHAGVVRSLFELSRAPITNGGTNG